VKHSVVLWADISADHRMRETHWKKLRGALTSGWVEKRVKRAESDDGYCRAAVDETKFGRPGLWSGCLNKPTNGNRGFCSSHRPKPVRWWHRVQLRTPIRIHYRRILNRRSSI